MRAPLAAFRFAILLGSLLSASVWAADDRFVVPRLENPVNDLAGLIQPGDANVLNQVARALKASTGTQIAVLTVPDLGDLSIEEASIKVTDAWGLGKKGEDRGVLLMVAAQNRKLRIEVGRGLEGYLPDAYAKRIIDNVIVPAFRQQKFSQGIVAGVFEIIHRTDPNFDLSPYAQGRQIHRQDVESSDDGGGFPIFFVAIIIITLLSTISRLFGSPYRRRGGFWGGPFGGGGFGGGGFGGGGGGGFSGGGGGFSGGGASGDW
jgi:uncharacterized protein